MCVLTGAAGIALVLLSSLAWADQFDTLNLHGSATYMQDNNLFRLPDGVDPLPLTGKTSRSDQVAAYQLGFTVDKPYGQQEFKLDASVTRLQYNTYTYLNYNAKKYSAEWLFHLSPLVSGKLKSEQTQTLSSFADYRGYSTGNINTNRSTSLDLDAWLLGNWHAIGSLGRTRYTNSQNYNQDQAFRSTDWSGGLRYDPGNDRTLTLRYQLQNGIYPNQTVNLASFTVDRFKQQQYELELVYPLSGKSVLNGKAAHVQRTYPNVSARDFSGWTGSLEWKWDLTGALGIDSVISHDINAYTDYQTSYVKTNKLSFGPYWQLSDKQLVNLSYQISERQYGGSPIPLATAARDDRIHSYGITWQWTPARMATIGANASHESRSSNTPGLDYRDWMGSLSATLNF